MNSPDHKLIEVAKRLAVFGMKTAQVYNQEQAKLQLELVLKQDRLSKSDGTQLSLSCLSKLRLLTSAHKDAYQKFLTQASAELSVALSELPSSLREERRVGIVASIYQQLQTQAKFYSNRGRWIDAAEKICRLVDLKREFCMFSTAGIAFAVANDRAQFNELLSIIEETHQIEVAILQERLLRLSQSAGVLGIKLF